MNRFLALVLIVLLPASTLAQSGVTLAWDAPAATGLTGFNVYRGNSSAALQKITATPLPSTQATFSDPNCASGSTCYYAVTALYGTTESAKSNVVQASPALTCPAGQFLAQYFANPTLSGAPALQACEASIAHDWMSGGPAGLPVDGFSARWTGTFTFAGGQTTFTAPSDDGIRIWLDGQILVDSWIDQGAGDTQHQVTVNVTAGDHAVKVEYYEDLGLASINVSWQQVPATPPPTNLRIVFASPTNGAVLPANRTATVSLQSSAPAQIQLFIDSARVKSGQGLTLTDRWRPKRGPHTLRGVATDSQNNSAEASVSVTAR